MITKRYARVHDITEHMTVKAWEAMLLDLAVYADAERPRLVLNCSSIFDMNRDAVCVLLSCLEVALKCNGDVRLAALHPSAEAELRHTGIADLFELFPTVEAAVHSFSQRPYSIAGMPAHETAVPALDYAA